MDYVTVREMRDKSGEIWQRLEAGEEFVVTRNGKPIGLLVHTEPHTVEERLRALRAAEFGALLRGIQQHAEATGASALTEAEIQSEIDAARQERRRARPSPAPMAAEPKSRPYARRR